MDLETFLIWEAEQMTLAIDFDGCLCSDYVKPGRRMGEPVDGAIEAMQLLSKQGHTLIIHTCRGDHPKHVEDWLRYWHIPFERVTNIKPDADRFIDDRAICFKTWQQTLSELA